MQQILNMSIVIPTNGRVSLVERLLKSLMPERESYPYGDTEVIIVNSGSEEDSKTIEELCNRYNAKFVPGENSVRKKRNLGIKTAQYEVILFLDSDVAAQKDLLKFHAEGFLNKTEVNLGGVFGLTEFVGEKKWWWKVVEQTTYLDSFSFAKMFPYNAWTIGNNVSFYKRILEEVGLFEENFPFPLGGDDLDLTYRITKSGYLIKSCPQAVTLHSTETWNHPKAIYDRTRRWGSMDYFLSQRHPEIFVDCIPKDGFLFGISLLICCLLSLIIQNTLPLKFLGIWFLINAVIVFWYDCVHKEGGNPLFYAIGKFIRMCYRIYYEIAGIKKKDFSCFHKEMSFSLDQTKYMQRREIAIFTIYLISFAISLTACIMIY